MLTIMAEEPNRPVNKGKSGCSIGRLSEINPKKPDRVKMTNARIMFSSLKIR